MPVSKAVLSFEPNVEMAKFLTGGGVRPMAASPTAITGELFCAPRLAPNWPIPTATAPAYRPAAAPRYGRALPGSCVMLMIRCAQSGGLPWWQWQAGRASGPNEGYG